MTARLISLFSGSSGNCTAISCGGDTILIDAGRSAKAIEEQLAVVGIDPGTLRAIFVTHEHIDHVSALRVLTKKHPVPVYASGGTADTLQCCVCRRAPLFEEHIGNMSVRSFPISHDAACPVGYRIEINADGGEHIAIGLATDTGTVTDEILRGLDGCRAVVLESNHDLQMLQSGPYPAQLKQRIRSRLGHLSNIDSADLAAALALKGTEQIILAHISKENNIPSLALSTCLERLQSFGVTANVLTALPSTPVGVTVEF